MLALCAQHPTWGGRKLRVRLVRQGIQPRPYGADDQIRKVQAGGWVSVRGLAAAAQSLARPTRRLTRPRNP